MQNQIAVVGGCNIDISATSYTFLIEADSNPGYVKTTLGGVGRNIAENLLLLGYPVSMITPLSRDSFLSQILSHSVEIGLDLSQSVYFDDVPNSVYLCINHPNGDIALAVSCMEICEKLTPDVISTQMDFLNSCPYVVLDANLRRVPLQGRRGVCSPADGSRWSKLLRLRRCFLRRGTSWIDQPEKHVGNTALRSGDVGPQRLFTLRCIAGRICGSLGADFE